MHKMCPEHTSCASKKRGTKAREATPYLQPFRPGMERVHGGCAFLGLNLLVHGVWQAVHMARAGAALVINLHAPKQEEGEGA